LRSAFHRSQGRKEMEEGVEGEARKRGSNGQRYQSNACGGAEGGRGSPAPRSPSCSYSRSRSRSRSLLLPLSLLSYRLLVTW
jgi:hypothetical protein